MFLPTFRRSLTRPVWAAALCVATVAATFTATGGAGAQTDPADEPMAVGSASTLPLSGHGWGHGRGMGQFGSLGYALEEGWASPKILNHFYGDTVAGTVPNSLMTVRLLSRDGAPLAVTVPSGTTLGYRVGSSGAVVPLGTQAARVVLVGQTSNGRGIYDVYTAASCAAAPTKVTRVTATGSGFDDHVAIVAMTNAAPAPDPDPVPEPDPDGTFVYGDHPDAVPVVGDWNGDGVDTVGYRIANQFHLRNSNSAGGDSIPVFSFGNRYDIPLVGDFDGDGVDEIGLKRTSDNNWYFQDGTVIYFGRKTWDPVIGDWNGDGADGIAAVDGTTWYFAETRRSGDADFVISHDKGGVPLGGNTEPDNGDDRNVYQASSRTFVLGSGSARRTVTFGSSGATPVLGDWDGDGIDEVGTFSNGTWQLEGVGRAGGATISAAAGSGTGAVGSAATNASVVSTAAADLAEAATAEPGSSAPAAADTLSGDGYAGIPGTEIVGAAGEVPDGDGSVRAASVPVSSAGVIDTNHPNLPLSQTLRLCTATGTTAYRGELRAAHFENEQRTVNAVRLEQYLRSVVPRESPASWADLGGGDGMAALESQAVAARSYSMAENRYTYAKTCDTISCQVYSGRQIGSFKGEDARADQAIANTAGVVRERSGSVARTEFSSSTGGHTAGGVFPAVADAGDDISYNPNHDWGTTLDRARIESYFGLGTLQTVAVVARNGLGEDGGRTSRVRLTFSGGVREVTGTSFQAAFGLKSDWFRFSGLPEPTPTPKPTTDTKLYVSNSLSTGVADTTFTFGTRADTVLVGDWDGDGTDTFLLRTGNGFRGSNSISGDLKSISFTFGQPGDAIFVGDWDGDGTDTLAYRRGNVFSVANTLGGKIDHSFSYGKRDDEVFVGDWDGDGADTFAVRRRNVFFASDRLTGGNADYTFGYGRAGDQVYVGDWNNDGRDSFAVRRKNVFYVSNTLTTSVAAVTFGYGKATDAVLVGDYDGDGVETITVRR